MFTTRVATVPDLPQVMPIIRQSYQHFGFPWDEEGKLVLLKQLVTRPDLGRLWLVAQESRVVGYALVAFWFSLEFDGRTALLDEFFLIPEVRASGVGGAVLDVVEADLHREGIQTVRLEVDRAHDRAATLYARRGYVASDRVLWRKSLGGR